MTTYRVPDSAYRDRRLSGTPLRVLLDLEERGYSKGHCWPSQGTIAANIGVARETVNRAVKVLGECGYLVKAGRRHRAVVCYLTVETSCDANVTRSCDAGVTQTPKREHIPSPLPPSPGKGDAASPDGDKSPKRRRSRRKERGGGQAAAPPTPRPPSPATGEGGAMVPVDPGGAVRAIAQQAGKSMKRATAAPRAPPEQAVLQSARKHLSTDRYQELCWLAAKSGDLADACLRSGLTKEGKPPNGEHRGVDEND